MAEYQQPDPDLVSQTLRLKNCAVQMLMVSSETKWWSRKVCGECSKVCAEAEKVCGEPKSLCCKFLGKTQIIEGPLAKVRLRSLCCKSESLWCIIINVTFDRHTPRLQYQCIHFINIICYIFFVRALATQGRALFLGWRLCWRTWAIWVIISNSFCLTRKSALIFAWRGHAAGDSLSFTVLFLVKTKA